MSSEKSKKAHLTKVKKEDKRRESLEMMSIICDPDQLNYANSIIKIFSEFLFRYSDADYHYNIDFLPEMYSAFCEIANSCNNMVGDLKKILEYADGLAIVKNFNAKLSAEENFFLSVNDLIRINIDNDLEWCEKYSEFTWEKMKKPYIFKIHYVSTEHNFFEVHNNWYDTMQNLTSFIKNVEKLRNKS